jgi:hypothetical protein
MTAAALPIKYAARTILRARVPPRSRSALHARDPAALAPWPGSLGQSVPRRRHTMASGADAAAADTSYDRFAGARYASWHISLCGHAARAVCCRVLAPRLVCYSGDTASRPAHQTNRAGKTHNFSLTQHTRLVCALRTGPCACAPSGVSVANRATRWPSCRRQRGLPFRACLVACPWMALAMLGPVSSRNCMPRPVQLRPNRDGASLSMVGAFAVDSRPSCPVRTS